MPLNEPNQTISDVHGLPVDPALLPLRSDRTIVYREGCSIPYEFKRSEDLLDYVVDMMKWLEAGEDIVSVLGWTDSDSLQSQACMLGVCTWIPRSIRMAVRSGGMVLHGLMQAVRLFD